MTSHEIANILDYYYPNPKCELEYNKDYELVLSVMLSAQTTDKHVNEITKKLYKQYDAITKLNTLSEEDLKVILKPLGLSNVKAKNFKEIVNILIDGYDLHNREFILSLPGIGRKCANVISSELFDEDYIAVDTHVLRVSKRLGLVKINDSVLNVEKKLTDFFKDENKRKIHLQLVLFGRYKCMAKKPMCENCKFKRICKEADYGN